MVKPRYFLCCDADENFTSVRMLPDNFFVHQQLHCFYRHCKIVVPPGPFLRILKNKKFTVNLTVLNPAHMSFDPDKCQAIVIDDQFE